VGQSGGKSPLPTHCYARQYPASATNFSVAGGIHRHFTYGSGLVVNHTHRWLPFCNAAAGGFGQLTPSL